MNPYLFSSDFRPDDEIILDGYTAHTSSCTRGELNQKSVWPFAGTVPDVEGEGRSCEPRAL